MQGLQAELEPEGEETEEGTAPFRREMENLKILFKLRAMVRLQRKQEVTNKKIMKEMIELHDFMAELQTLTN